MSAAWVKFLFGFYLLFLVWAAATVLNPADPDLWHRLAVGEFLWKTGHFPTGDTFSYLADYQTIADHEWGAALIFYGLWTGGGGTAMVLTKLVTLAVTLSLVVRAGLGVGRPTAVLAGFYALVLLALLPSFQSTVRCMVFTHLFFALWVYWFQRERQGHRVPILLYILTMVIWANLHGGFVMGLAWLWAVGFVEWRESGEWKRNGVRLALCALSTLINPFGVQLWVATVRALMTTRKGFDEWAPVSWVAEPLSYPGYKLLLLVVLAVVVARIYRSGWKQIDRAGVILIGIFLALAMTSARHTSLFAIVAGALLPGFFLAERGREPSSDPVRRLGRTAIQCASVLVPLFVALRVLPGAGLELELPPSSCPVRAVEYLAQENIRGKLLVSFNNGSYALWELRGRMRVSMDGRYDLVYRPETYRRVDNFFFARGDWERLLTSPAPDAVLVGRHDPVYPRLEQEAGWREFYSDSNDVIFVPR